jgi:hypothetical protein
LGEAQELTELKNSFAGNRALDGERVDAIRVRSATASANDDIV